MIVYSKEKVSGLHISEKKNGDRMINLFGNFVFESPNAISAFIYYNLHPPIVYIHPKEYLYPLVFKI
jgi:hypothetical protein